MTMQFMLPVREDERGTWHQMFTLPASTVRPPDPARARRKARRKSQRAARRANR